MKTIPKRRPSVAVGRDDPSLTPAAGLVLVAEVDRIPGVVSTIDAYVGSIKARRQGLSAGELVLSVAETMLAGGDFMIDLDNQARPDTAGAPVRAVADAPASTTFIALAKRFDEVAIGDLGSAMRVLVCRAFAALPEKRRAALASPRPTIDLKPRKLNADGQTGQSDHAGHDEGGRRRHQVLAQHIQRAASEAARRGDEATPPQLQRLAAQDPGDPGPGQEPDDGDGGRAARRDEGGEDHDQGQRRQGEGDICDPHGEGIRGVA